MHAMSHRSHHHFQQHQSPAPQTASPYQVYPPSANLSAASVNHHRQQQNKSPIAYAPYLVTHQGPYSSTRPRSPIVPTPTSLHSPRPNSSASTSVLAHAHSHSCDQSPVRSTTPHPPEDVVMTSTINFTRDTRDRPIINQYLIGHRLGNGQHGEVYKGFDMRRGNMVVAIKACKRKNPKEAKHEQLRQRNQGGLPRTVGGFGGYNARPRLVDQLQSAEKKVLREIAIMKKCKHGQIVQLYEVINDRLTNKILLVMEYMGGGEVKWRDDNARPCLRVDQTRRICRDVVLGLLYLHHQGIIHRDIKPANLLWTANRKNVKITDFGVSHFSAAERIDALRHSEAYRIALERRKKEYRRREEEASGTATPGRRRGGWRGRGMATASKVDLKGKGRALDDPTASSPTLVSDPISPTSALDDAAIEAEVLAELAGETDPILLDDGGLSRQAGTPSFLAPEIIWGFGGASVNALVSKIKGKATMESVKNKDVEKNGDAKHESGEKDEVESSGRDGADMDKAPASSSTTATLKTLRRPSPSENASTPRAFTMNQDLADDTNSLEPMSFSYDETQSTIPDPDPASFHDPNAVLADAEEEAEAELPPRPPITKAIDVWALGVTLYCLLFGRTPWGGVTEWAMYQMIHENDFMVDGVMGYDRVPTGGRFHDAEDTSEGAVVVGLLDRLLEKDCMKRITLDEVKGLPWITRDIPNPDAWLAETAPHLHDPIRITDEDEDVAMSTVKFRWKFDMSKPFRRFRTLLPGPRGFARQQHPQTQRHVDDREFYDAELDAMLERSIHLGSGSERDGRPASSVRRRVGGSEATGLQRKPSRSRRVLDAVERSARIISRQGSSTHGSGGETPRSLKRRTLPDIMIGGRDRSMSRSRDGSLSRPTSRAASRASGPATPRVTSGGSCSNLTSPSTGGFTSEGETDILDAEDVRAVRASRRVDTPKERREWEKERQQKASTRNSLSNVSKILSWIPKPSPRQSLSESSSKGSLGMGWRGLSKSPANPPSPISAGGNRNGTENGAAPTRPSFASQRLARRSADEVGARAGLGMGLGGVNGARGVPGSMGARSGSGPALGSAGVATAGRGLALASADELTSAMRASSWGEVADEYNYDFNAGGEYEDGDGASDYGYASGSAYGDYYVYGNGGSYGFGSDVDGFANDDDEVRLVGAGGILSHPVSGPSSPSSLSGVSAAAGLSVPPEGFSLHGATHDVGSANPGTGSASAQVIVSGGGIGALPLLQTQLQDVGRRRGTSVGSRHQHSHYSHVISSPLAQTPLNLDRDAPMFDNLHLKNADDALGTENADTSPDGEAAEDEDGDDDDASSESGIRIYGRGARYLAVDEEVPDIEVFAEDESSSDDEPEPIVVRRRRPSELLSRSHSRPRPDSAPGSHHGDDDDAEIY